MVKPVKSVLLVDLDGLGASLAASGGEGMDTRLAERIGDWSGAIESGELTEPAGTLCAIAERRCYTRSASTDEALAAFAHAGFEIVECDGQAEVDVRFAIDAMDAAADADGELAFILLTVAPDLTPLVERLRARGHHVAVYVSDATAAAYRGAADRAIPASRFVALLAASEARPQAAPPAASAERGKIEAFAREIHAATSIPMFSPRTFADLFRILAEEVTRHGYHFNDTAKTVAERLAGAGRNVTSRQVVFVVKGLALKGHVFSTDDTAERLAEVFREQARYLIGGAGITLDADRETLLAAWIAAPAVPAAKPARPTRPAPESKPPPESKPARAAEPPADSKPARKPERRPEKPTAAKPATPRVPERPKSAALPSRAAPPPPDTQKPAKPSPDFRAAIAARIAASAKLKPSARPPQTAEEPAPPPPPEPAAAPEKAEDTIESSILAAIAEAVDVLVEDGGNDTAEPRSTPSERGARQPAARRAAANRPPPPEPPPPAEEPEEESGDIGDEIQRIVASYNRNRDDERRG